MKYNSNHDHALYLLVSEYEARSQEGILSFLTDQDFSKLITYYEREFLFEKALEVIEHALKHYGFSADFHIKKAELLLATKNSEQAMSTLDTAEIFAPAEIEVQLLRAKILCATGEYSKAISLIESIKPTAYDKDLSDIFLCEAQIYECLKEYDEMFDCLKRSLEYDIENEDALERIWVCTEMTKRYNESIEIHQDLLNKNPYSYLAWYNLGHAYSCKGKYREAIEAYEFSFIINDEFELGYRECAEICCQIEEYNKGLKYYQEVLDCFGPDSDLLANIGECYFQLNSFTEAKQYFRKASKLDPYNDEVHFYLGLCHAREDRWLSAINSYFRAIEIEDRREEYFDNLAKAFSNIGEFAKAHYYFLKATEIGPEQSEIWIDHVTFLLKIGETDKALEVIEEAGYNAVGSELNYCKTACLFASGRKTESFNLLKDSLEEDYDNHKVLFKILPEMKDDEKVMQLIHYSKLNS